MRGLALCCVAALASVAGAQSTDLYSEMHWRSIGPSRAGRARAVAGVPSQPNVAYIGFDCTAPSLHVGSMVQIMCLYWLQQTGNKPIALTAREVGVVRWLYRHRARTVSRGELLEHVWNTRPDMETRTVDMTIAHLRHKIERDPANPAIIVSVKGVGYAWGQA